MKTLDVSRRALAITLGAVLLACAAPTVIAAPSTAEKPVKALLTFGDPSHIDHAGDLLAGLPKAAVLAGGSLPADQLKRYALPSAGAVAVVAARDIASLGESRAVLMRLFNAGVPVFVCADDAHGSDVAGLFGMSPETGDAMFVRQANGEVALLDSASGEQHWNPRWSQAMAASVSSLREDNTPEFAGLDDTSTQDAAKGAGEPIYTFHEGLIETGTDEITGRATIQVIRSASKNGDDKEISVRAWSTITPKGVGVVTHQRGRRGVPTKVTATLPWVYRASHRVVADGAQAQMVHSLPGSMGSTGTRMDYEKVGRRGYTIGGGMGAHVSASGKPSAALAAKLRFNLSFSYTRESTETIRYSFLDYSLFARTVDGGKRMLWEAPIAPHLKDALVENSRKKKFNGKNMTPMMFSGSLDTWSVWKLPGDYEGKVTVAIEAGYDRNERLASWVKPRRGYFEETKTIKAGKSYVFDLSHPFLTREITVLIRSAAGDGGCLTQTEGKISVASCDPSNRSQMWGLDSESRYVNRATKQCLTADTEDALLRMSSCTLANSQRWEWRADRLHSGYDDGRHRLYVELGKVRFHVPPGRFEDVPVNPHNAVLSPWSGYPRAPLAGELIPAPHGVNAGSVPSSWASTYRAISPEQRWDVIVLRAGLAPNL
ncbi:hypothetical protein BJI69_15040 [Luteibacter rhizovicinus DSM 16549]|uniref:Uncharacterized protein n=1 Tax=Luteibacter rhizovicinus DSM 16549 TaxID=1440763 RepID=A0A0G9HEB8_9GAMM|nr:RICIN domain-containing protein [Luteibacter rhizovicinus]APG05080.1 hypothetical protein BJI69_15040 [Luteibacter rhizovicinus DSM 16549]KLD67519.1 hypothetical protein Y883_07545 [Luteibacter rhizovicinus DSM 16549]KLD76942.1 hypothetical protein Y886_18245 [Xanthomonas hyacinthi DSM 19077]